VKALAETNDSTTGTLNDPAKIISEHTTSSNGIKGKLPAAMEAIDKAIHDFSYEIGPRGQELYENLATTGVAIITGLEALLADVLTALSALYELLTTDNLEENLKVAQDKYIAINNILQLNNHLGDISVELPFILESINAVKAAFETILASLNAAKDKINSGIYDPSLIFSEKHDEVVTAWQTFEVRRKTMTYLPYKY
jgi:hypothetical protein